MKIGKVIREVLSAGLLLTAGSTTFSMPTELRVSTRYFASRRRQKHRAGARSMGRRPGSGTAPDQTGLLNTTGVLTKAFATGGSDTEIDTILEAATAIRVGPAFGNADLLILNPQDWLSLRQIKTSFDSYVLKQNDPGELGGIDHLFQLRVAQTTSIPQGIALVLDSSIAVNIFRRWGLTVEVNPWAGNEFKANQLLVRAETRLGVGAIYPKAICKVTNLFPAS